MEEVRVEEENWNGGTGGGQNIEVAEENVLIPWAKLKQIDS